MRICLATPAPHGSRKGNRITAQRWASILRSLGHQVTIVGAYNDQRCDLLIALHATRSRGSMVRFRVAHPGKPIVLALTGTDLYDELQRVDYTKRALDWANRLIVLQRLGVQALPEEHRAKARVIYQSMPPPRFRVQPRTDCFEVCVLGHLREVKDPFRTAAAARLLPPTSQIQVLHLGAALSAEMAAQVKQEAAANPRYRWLGDVPRWRAMRILARCRLLVLTSRLEGGANVISEALAHGVPVLSSRIAGSLGMLGEDYPGYFPVGDTDALAALLLRVESDPAFYRELQARCAALKPLVDPATETECWRALLAELEFEGRVPPEHYNRA